MTTYRAAYYLTPDGDQVRLTGPSEADLPDSTLAAAGIAEMLCRWPDLPFERVRDGLRIGEWVEHDSSE